MQKLLSAVCVALLVALPQFAAAQTNPKAAAEKRLLAQNAKTLGFPACSLCFTCGGPWPFLSGGFISPGSNNVLERGNQCSGGLRTFTDSRPLLCCGRDE